MTLSLGRRKAGRLPFPKSCESMLVLILSRRIESLANFRLLRGTSISRVDAKRVYDHYTTTTIKHCAKHLFFSEFWFRSHCFSGSQYFIGDRFIPWGDRFIPWGFCFAKKEETLPPLTCYPYFHVSFAFYEADMTYQPSWLTNQVVDWLILSFAL